MQYLIEFLITVVDRFAVAAVRGAIIIGALYLAFWVYRRPSMNRHRVSTTNNAAPRPLKEALLTFSTYFVYSIATAIVIFVAKYGSHSMMYTNVADYGWFYTILSVPLFLFYIDTAFYWSHVLMHKNRFFRRAHVTHHQFVNVTPWGGFAFHLAEAVINASSFLILMLFVPWHPVSFVSFIILSLVYSGFIHLGYDFMPLSWRSHPVLKWLNTPTHHIYHHHKHGYNFGFIFTFWDKIMGTEKLPCLTPAHKADQEVIEKKVANG